jgi:Uma2 family endonuclease
MRAPFDPGDRSAEETREIKPGCLVHSGNQFLGSACRSQVLNEESNLMSMMTLTRPVLPLPKPADVYRLTVDQYDRMVEQGVLGEDDPVELLGGILVRKMPKKPGHVIATDDLRKQLERILPAGWHLRKDDPVRIPDYDEPEPDLAVVRGHSRTYGKRHPEPGDIALLVEVAETTLAKDRGEKMSAYSRAGVPVYWIVNLTRRAGVVEVYTRPTRTRGYRTCEYHKAGHEIAVTIEAREVGRIAVADFLP